MTTTVLQDSRPIYALSDIEAQEYIAVGQKGVTHIAAYGEPGQFCAVPWFAIYRGTELWRRIPAGRAQVYYSKP